MAPPVFIPETGPHEQVSLWYMMALLSFLNVGPPTHASRSTCESSLGSFL